MTRVRSAAGNRFVTREPPNVMGTELTPEALEAWLGELQGNARDLCDQHTVDGVIAFLPPEAGGDLRLVFFNADGSRPEACGNGLRVAARYARELGHVAGDEMVLETDAGLRVARLLRETRAAVDPQARAGLGDDAGEIVAAEVSLGVARDLGDVALVVPDAELVVAHVELGNPHAVWFVADPAQAPVHTLGPAIERHPRFPERINVGFARSSAGGLTLRVWERGVGETRACGTGAAAAALAAVNRGVAHWPVAVDLPGGRLVVRAGKDGELWLTGPC